MNSGKSMFLLASANNFEEREIPFICLKSNTDNRENQNVIHSRSGFERECISINKEDNIFSIIYKMIIFQDAQLKKRLQWILVDESQFLTKEHINELSDIVDKLDINVICFGLRTDFQAHLFEGSQRLMEIADTIEEIKSSCSCGNKNIYNVRIDNEGNIITHGEQVLIGSEDKYIALCRKCFKEKISKK